MQIVLEKITAKVIKNNKLLLKSQAKLRSKKNKNAFTEKVNRIPLSANDDKRMQLIDSAEIYTYETNEDIKHGKKEIKHNNIIKHCYKND